MQSLAAIVVAALLSVAGPSALQHVHVYGDHDHETHQHGPAAHGHAVAHHHSHPAETPVTLERCDPGEHAVSVSATGVAPYVEPVPLSVTTESIAVRPPDEAWRHFTPPDVRAHSPPRLTDAPLRAPPVIHPA